MGFFGAKASSFNDLGSKLQRGAQTVWAGGIPATQKVCKEG
jgi:hypothetical protein